MFGHSSIALSHIGNSVKRRPCEVIPIAGQIQRESFGELISSVQFTPISHLAKAFEDKTPTHLKSKYRFKV